MPDQLEGRARDLFAAKNYAIVSVPRADGTVQTVIAWIEAEGDVLTLNSAEGRSWPANLRKAGTATVTVMADSNPYEWASVTGRLREITTEGADDHIDALARKYIGQDYPYRQPDETRVRIVLEPERVTYVKAD